MVLLRGAPFSVGSAQIPIFNCGSDMAAINARIDGPMAHLIQVSPETATIPREGQLIFSLKYSSEGPQPDFQHQLIRKF